MRDHELLHRFLLGELKERKAERVEKRLLNDDELFDLCEAIEAELLDAVARGELAPAERERVLQRLASSPQGRARLALAEGLAAETADRRASTESMPAPLPFRRRPTLTARPAVRWAVAAGLVVVLGGGAAWWINTRPEGENQVATVKPDNGTRSEIKIERPPAPPITKQVIEETPPETEPVAPPPPDLIAEQNGPEPPPGHGALAPKTWVVQLASLLRDEEEKLPQVEIPAGTARVQFQMDAREYEFESYGATVTRDGEGVWTEPRLKPEPMAGGPVLVLDVPAGKLRPGIYKVEIQGNPVEGAPQFLMHSVFEVAHERSVSNP